MKTEYPNLIITLPFTDNYDPGFVMEKHTVVNYKGSPCSDSQNPIGVCAENITDEDLDKGSNQVSVIASGVALCLSAEALNAGQFVRVDNGKVTATDVYPDYLPFGVALDSASGVDELVRVKIL